MGLLIKVEYERGEGWWVYPQDDNGDSHHFKHRHFPDTINGEIEAIEMAKEMAEEFDCEWSTNT